MNPARSVRRRPLLLDTGVAALLAIASGALLFLYIHDASGKLAPTFGSRVSLREHVLLWSLASAGCVAALVIRHRSPPGALALASAAVAVHYADVRLPHLPLDLAAPITLYTLASLAPARRSSLLALAGALAAAAAVTLWPQAALIGKSAFLPFTTVAVRMGDAAVVPVLILTIAWVVGDGTRTRRAYLRTLQQRAADLERERDQRAALATAAERARITREMHDVIAHGLSVMVAQAQGAAAALHRHPGRTEAALDQVVTTGRQSLAEMRLLLGVVRGSGTDGPGLSPQPGLATLPALINQVRQAGMPVQLTVEDEPTAVPAALSLSAYRIVQEALTNTLKHAGRGTRASVRVAFRSGSMEIDVADDGRGAGQACVDPGGGHPDDARAADFDDRHNGNGHRSWPDDAAGNGLRGIRERVEMLGGQVTAGLRPEGGFRVHAVVPLRAAGDRAGDTARAGDRA